MGRKRLTVTKDGRRTARLAVGLGKVKETCSET